VSRKVVYSDPEFAAEMEALAQARRDREGADKATFAAAWAKRLETPVPVAHPSPLHLHENSCWSEPFDVIDKGVRLRVQRCATSNTLREVT
jgi:hypothetical protein